MLYTIEPIKSVCQSLHKQGKSIVLATGFFDLLHSEHSTFLHKAKAAGDILIVAVESDLRARQIKGEGRPLQTQSLRCQTIIARDLADHVVALGDDFNNPRAYESLIAAILPQVYAVSGHTEHLENKRSVVEKYGGKLVMVHEFNPHISTTKLVSENHV